MSVHDDYLLDALKTAIADVLDDIEDYDARQAASALYDWASNGGDPQIETKAVIEDVTVTVPWSREEQAWSGEPIRINIHSQTDGPTRVLDEDNDEIESDSDQCYTWQQFRRGLLTGYFTRETDGVRVEFVDWEG